MRKYKERGGVTWLVLAAVGIGVGSATGLDAPVIIGVIMIVAGKLERISNGLHGYFNGD